MTRFRVPRPFANVGLRARFRFVDKGMFAMWIRLKAVEDTILEFQRKYSVTGDLYLIHFAAGNTIQHCRWLQVLRSVFLIHDTSHAGPGNGAPKRQKIRTYTPFTVPILRVEW